MSGLKLRGVRVDHPLHPVEQRPGLGHAEAGPGRPDHQGEAAPVRVHVEPVDIALEALLDLLARQRLLRVEPVSGRVAAGWLGRRRILVVELHGEGVRFDDAPADLLADGLAGPLQVLERDEQRPVGEVPVLHAFHGPVHRADLIGTHGEEVPGQLRGERLAGPQPLRAVERFDVHVDGPVAADALDQFLDQLDRGKVLGEQLLEAGADLQARGQPDGDGRQHRRTGQSEVWPPDAERGDARDHASAGPMHGASVPQRAEP